MEDVDIPERPDPEPPREIKLEYRIAEAKKSAEFRKYERHLLIRIRDMCKNLAETDDVTGVIPPWVDGLDNNYYSLVELFNDMINILENQMQSLDKEIQKWENELEEIEEDMDTHGEGS